MSDALVRRFEGDDQAVREVSMLRRVAAVASLVAALWFFAINRSWAGVLLFAVTSIAAGFWFRKARAASELVQAARSLELRPDGFVIVHGQTSISVAWREVKQVLLDYDSLTIKVVKADDSVLVVEPEYRGVTFDELGEAFVALHKVGASALPADSL